MAAADLSTRKAIAILAGLAIICAASVLLGMYRHTVDTPALVAAEAGPR